MHQLIFFENSTFDQFQTSFNDWFSEDYYKIVSISHFFIPSTLRTDAKICTTVIYYL